MNAKARLLAIRDSYRKYPVVEPSTPPWDEGAPVIPKHTTLMFEYVGGSGSSVSWGVAEKRVGTIGVSYGGSSSSLPKALIEAIQAAPAAEKVCMVFSVPSVYYDCSQRLWTWLEKKQALPAWGDLAEEIQRRNVVFCLACNGTSEIRDRALQLAQGEKTCCPVTPPQPIKPKSKVITLRKR